MPQLTFKVQGATQLSRNLRVLADNIADPSDAFDAALDLVTARSDSLWAREGSNVEKANPWAPLAASTVKARERRWGYYKRSPSRPGTMRWTGNLQETRDKHVSRSGGRLTFMMPYGGYHQSGGKNLPRRVIVDLSNETNAEIVRAFQKKIQKDIGIFGRQV